MDEKESLLNDILNDEHNICQLDQVVIKEGYAIEARIGLGMELFFAPRDQHKFYPILNQLVEDYYNRFSSNLNCYQLIGRYRISLLRKNFLDKLHNQLTKIDYDKVYDTHLFYDDTGEGVIFNASPWQAHFYAKPKQRGELSSINLSISVCDEECKPNFDKLAELVASWCEQAKPSFGTAGFCFAYSRSPSTKYSYALMQRHPGIEHMDDIGFMVATCYVANNQEHFITNRIKGINWLTILSNELVAELGGLAHCKASLEPDCYVKTYDGGVIIFAGSVPQLGDNYQDMIPQQYQKVARFTKPIRFEDYRRGYLKLDEPLDSYEESMKWIRRFD